MAKQGGCPWERWAAALTASHCIVSERVVRSALGQARCLSMTPAGRQRGFLELSTRAWVSRPAEDLGRGPPPRGDLGTAHSLLYPSAYHGLVLVPEMLPLFSPSWES